MILRLHLVEAVGRISLAEVTLIEDPSDEERIDEGEWQLDGVVRAANEPSRSFTVPGEGPYSC